jgi:hypothetical protein
VREPVYPARGTGRLHLVAFINRHRRLPRLGDAPPPWRYRGWLLLYVILLHGRCPAVAGRWAYQLRTIGAGGPLDEPIACNRTRACPTPNRLTRGPATAGHAPGR